MATETTSTTSGNAFLAAGAIMALGVMVIGGCQANSATLMYAREAHAQQVAAWCYNAHFGGTTAYLQQECVRRVWINVPPGECFYDPCIETHGYGAPYDARRGRIDK